MDQDFYIEDTSPWKIAIIIIIVAALIGGGIFAYYKYFRDNIVKLKEVTVELGEKLPTDIDSYISAKNINVLDGEAKEQVFISGIFNIYDAYESGYTRNIYFARWI